MAAYCLPEDVRERAGGAGDNPSGLLKDSSIPDADIVEYIAERQEQVDAVLSARYATPFDSPGPVPRLVFRIVRDLATADSINQAMAKSFGSETESTYAAWLEKEALSLMNSLLGGSVQLPGLVQFTRLLGKLAPLDPRNLLPEAAASRTWDPTDTNTPLPTNAAGQQDSDILVP